MKKNIIALRIDDETLSKIQKQAKKENRTKSNFVLSLIKKYIDENK